MEEEMYQAYQKLQEHEQECKHIRDMEIQRLHQELDNSIPILLIKKKIEELREKVDGDDYWKYTEKDYLGMQYQIEVLQQLLDERNNTDEQ